MFTVFFPGIMRHCPAHLDDRLPEKHPYYRSNREFPCVAIVRDNRNAAGSHGRRTQYPTAAAVAVA
jgi:hypothetical protein